MSDIINTSLEANLDQPLELDPATQLYRKLRHMHETVDNDDCITSIAHDNELIEHLYRMTEHETVIIYTMLIGGSFTSHIEQIETVPAKQPGTRASIMNTYDTHYEVVDDQVTSTGRHYIILNCPGDEGPDPEWPPIESETKVFDDYRLEVDTHPPADLAQLLGLLSTNGVIAK